MKLVRGMVVLAVVTPPIASTRRVFGFIAPRYSSHTCDSCPLAKPASLSIGSLNWSARARPQDLSRYSTNNHKGSSAVANNDSSPRMLQQFTLLTPGWTILAALIGLRYADALAPTLGSVQCVSRALALLMLVMALSTTPDDFSKALQSRGVLAMNAVCCFGLMPMLGIFVARLIGCTPQQSTGTILLGSVSGGQASNLFALLAGGDVALSVICTLSTTLMGVVATPILAKLLLSGSSIAIDGMAVLYSVITLVLAPLLLGIGLGRTIPSTVQKWSKAYPVVGIGATLCLVAGGAANSAKVSFGIKAALASVVLPLLGGMAAFLLGQRLPERSKRTLVVEVLSKSPTLAYVLALTHFDSAAATVPAAGMVSLAVVGALVACVWRLFPIFDDR